MTQHSAFSWTYPIHPQETAPGLLADFACLARGLARSKAQPATGVQRFFGEEAVAVAADSFDDKFQGMLLTISMRIGLIRVNSSYLRDLQITADLFDEVFVNLTMSRDG